MDQRRPVAQRDRDDITPPDDAAEPTEHITRGLSIVEAEDLSTASENITPSVDNPQWTTSAYKLFHYDRFPLDLPIPDIHTLDHDLTD